MTLVYRANQAARSFLGILFLLSSQVKAAATLDWPTCVDLAKNHALLLKEAQENIHKGQENITTARSDFLPHLSATAGVSQDRQSQSVVPVDIRNDFSLGLTIKQSLYSGGSGKASLERSRLNLESSQLEAEQAKIKLGHDLRAAFDTVLYNQELIRVIERALARRKQNTSIVQLRYEGGSEHKGSLLKAKASRLQAEADLSQAKRALKLAKAQLARTVGQDLETDITLLGRLREGPSLSTEPDFETIATQLIARRKAVTDVQANEASIRVQRSTYYPQIAAEAGVTRASSIWPPDSNRYTVGVSISMMLYDGSKTPANVRAATADLMKAKWALADTEKQALLNLKQSFTTLVDSKERVHVLRQILKASEVQAQVTRSQYTLGLTTFQTWDQIESDLIHNERSLLQGYKDLAQAQTEWESSIGKKIEEITP
ncbi:MAG: TolC family protein [Oligoflexales bacterium]|nr:TolC family protein [Oligoflexales bacterium]